jgi:hypothetical protein
VHDSESTSLDHSDDAPMRVASCFRSTTWHACVHTLHANPFSQHYSRSITHSHQEKPEKLASAPIFHIYWRSAPILLGTRGLGIIIPRLACLNSNVSLTIKSVGSLLESAREIVIVPRGQSCFRLRANLATCQWHCNSYNGHLHYVSTLPEDQCRR